MRLDGREYELVPGTCFCLGPRPDLTAEHDRHRRLGVCFIHFDFIKRRVEPPPVHCVLSNVPYFEMALKHAVERFRLKTHWACAEAQSIVQSVLHAMAAGGEKQTEPSPADNLAPIIRALREEPGKRVSVEELADSVGYSCDHFSRLFAEATGRTPQAFIIGIRIERARQLLDETRLGVGEIADGLGYVDIYSFSRQFKHVAGLSPQQWRKRRA